MNNLKEKYDKEVAGKLQTEFGLTNKMSIPRLEKVVISIGLAEAKERAPDGQLPSALKLAVDVFEGVEDNLQVIQKVHLAQEDSAREEDEPGEEED